MLKLTRLNGAEPLFRPRDLPWEKMGVLNAAATVYNGKILLLYRAVGDDHVSRFGTAVSSDGVHFEYTSDQPIFAPDPNSTYETLGVEDPRISYINGKYAIVYVASTLNQSEARPNATDWKTRISLAWTTDFANFERKGVIMHNYNDKDATLFPVQWPDPNGDFYYLYHRRHPSIWLSKSRDLNTWEDVCSDTCMVVQPDGNSWDNDRIGIGTQPLYTEEGWIVFYHGRDKNGTYRISAFLADLQKPDHIIAKLPYPILEPEYPFEQNGIVPNVVFTCGAVDIADTYWVYYGGADYTMGGAFIDKKSLLNELKAYAQNPLTVGAINFAK